jgi:hypothetical protein
MTDGNVVLPRGWCSLLRGWCPHQSTLATANWSPSLRKCGLVGTPATGQIERRKIKIEPKRRSHRENHGALVTIKCSKRISR